MAGSLKNILHGSTFGAIEAFSEDAGDRYAWTLIGKQKGELDIRKEGIAKSPDELKKVLAGFPVLLCINTKQVIHKEIEDTDASDKKLLHKAFPNISQNEFYFSIWRRESSSVIAICRRNYATELLTSVGKNINVVAIYIGITPIAGLVPFGLPERLSTASQELYTGRHFGFIQPLTEKGAPANINGLTIQPTAVIGFAGVVSFLFPSGVTGNLIQDNDTREEAWLQRALFNMMLKSGAAILLALLVLNFLVFSHYFDKANALSEKVELDKAGLQGVVRLRERVKEKETLVRSISAIQSKASPFVNSLVKDLPFSVLLTSLEYHPLERKLKEGEAMEIRDSIITINGAVKNNADFNAWVERKQRLKNVAGVTITHFGADGEGNTVFTINVKQK